MPDSGRPSNRAVSRTALIRAMAAVVLTLGFCWGCDETGQSDCGASDYCGSGLVCRDDKCVELQCYSRKDCSTDEICVSGLSVGQNPALMYCSASCSDTNPCAGAGKVCVNGICQQGSVPDDITQETIIIEDVGGDGFTPDGSTQDGSTPDVARPDGTSPDGGVEDVVQDVPAELPPVEMGPDCKTCLVADDCGTGYSCQPVGAEKHCLRDCVNDGDCEAGYICYSAGLQKSCLPVSYNCVACTFDAPCDNGKCCDFSSGACNDCAAQCSPCAYDYDCDIGMRCHRPGGNPTGVCVPECGDRECADKTNYTCADNGKGVEICMPNTICKFNECEPDCGSNECGMDPVCGTLNCGTCGEGHLCDAGHCAEDNVWIPDNYTVSCSDGMCLIPAGPFWMGCNSEIDSQCWPDESPYHEVMLSGYYMDKTEVTQLKYRDCVYAGSCTAPRCNWDPSGTPNRPVVCVNWTQAGDFCTWSGKRLPTEAEWEKAARGTDGRIYPWGNETATCDYAVMFNGIDGCGTGGAMDVCSKSPAGDSPYGLCDMSGNVWEWLLDWSDSDYYKFSPGSSQTTAASGSSRGGRGGSFNSVDGRVRASARGSVDPSDAYVYLGFRCVKPQ